MSRWIDGGRGRQFMGRVVALCERHGLQVIQLDRAGTGTGYLYLRRRADGEDLLLRLGDHHGSKRRQGLTCDLVAGSPERLWRRLVEWVHARSRRPGEVSQDLAGAVVGPTAGRMSYHRQGGKIGGAGESVPCVRLVPLDLTP